MGEESVVSNGLMLYVVYFSPIEYPGMFVVRRQYASKSGVSMDADPLAIVLDLDTARHAIPFGLIPMPPEPGDDPSIQEVWM